MALFEFGKKNEEKKNTSCCCGGTPAPAEQAEPACACNGDAAETVASECCCGGSRCSIQSIKVLGLGCKSCHAMNEASIAAVKELGLELEVEYVTDPEKIMNYGVMSMPALVVNEKVVSTGKVLKTADIVKLLEKLGCC